MSCYNNNTCRPNYIGTFSIDTSQIINPIAKKYVQEYRFDTVRLISNSKGKYYFQGNNTIIKEYEGEWFTKSDDIEGNCSGYIRQKNMNQAFPRIAFDIYIRIQNETYILPFRKIKSIP